MSKIINNELYVLAQETFDKVKSQAGEYSGTFGSIKALIVEHFGQNGLIAAYIVLAALILVLISRLGKITFSTFKYLVIPSVAIAFLGAYFLPYSFIALLPFSVTFCSLVFLFKG